MVLHNIKISFSIHPVFGKVSRSCKHFMPIISVVISWFFKRRMVPVSDMNSCRDFAYLPEIATWNNQLTRYIHLSCVETRTLWAHDPPIAYEINDAWSVKSRPHSRVNFPYSSPWTILGSCTFPSISVIKEGWERQGQKLYAPPLPMTRSS